MNLIDISPGEHNLPNILMPFNTSANSANANKSSKQPQFASPQQHQPQQQQTSRFILNDNDYQVDNANLKFPNLQGATAYHAGAATASSQSAASNYSYNPSNDANKAFDNVVFDILKVDPDDIAGQLTLIDIPLFKLIEPDELISCKWMSREKLIKAPNIVQFTRRFNQTTFWCQKEILNCKRIETRGKMITHFIKIAKRLNELHSFNSLMAIIVALKAQPIYRLKKTWSQHVSKRDVSQFERLADLMFDTSDNKRKMRDMHMNCKLPCIPFLGLFLTDLIHIDIAHPHNSFDNPQRRNQMNNICRLVSEYQQSNYQDLTSLSCDCCFSVINTELTNIGSNDPNNSNDSNTATTTTTTTTNTACLVSNCNCLIHHGHGYGSGIINNDGTIYITEISYVKNYLNSFLYIEELQKFKEDENYRDSLELEPDAQTTLSVQHANQPDKSVDNMCDSLTPSIHVSASSPCKLSNQNSLNGIYDLKTINKQGHQSLLDPNNVILGQQHRKSQSIASNMLNYNLVNETKELINELKLKHPLDESLEAVDEQLPQINTAASTATASSSTGTDLISDLPALLQQKQLLASVKINDPSSLLKELLKHRHNSATTTTTNTTAATSYQSSKSTQNHSSLSFKNKFNCYSSSADVDDDSDDEPKSDLDDDNNNLSIDDPQQHLPTDVTELNSTPIKLFNLSLDSTCSSLRQNNTNHTTSSSSSKLGANTSKKKAKGSIKKSLLNSTVKSEKSNHLAAAATSNPNSCSSTSGNQVKPEANFNYEASSQCSRRLSGRNLMNHLNDEHMDTVDSTLNKQRSANGSMRQPVINKTSSTNDLFPSNSLVEANQQHHQSSQQHDDMASFNMHDLSGITNLSNILALEQQIRLILFESPVKRKCIIKNFRKPRFSQWKSYWLQLIGGNLLIYYPIKTLMFNTSNVNNKSRRSSEQNYYIDEFLTHSNESSSQNNADINLLHQEIQQQQKKELMQTQLQQRKVCYNKNPCKMHPINSWMVVNLFQDKENEIIQAAQQLSSTIASNSTHQTSSSKPNWHLNCPQYTKFDIQLNDLNNGNMYKYRFDSLQLAREWYEQFKLASTYHEREKPDNLIRFD